MRLPQSRNPPLNPFLGSDPFRWASERTGGVSTASQERIVREVRSSPAPREKGFRRKRAGDLAVDEEKARTASEDGWLAKGGRRDRDTRFSPQTGGRSLGKRRQAEGGHVAKSRILEPAKERSASPAKREGRSGSDRPALSRRPCAPRRERA
jgi:hypothetical protein